MSENIGLFKRFDLWRKTGVWLPKSVSAFRLVSFFSSLRKDFTIPKDKLIDALEFNRHQTQSLFHNKKELDKIGIKIDRDKSGKEIVSWNKKEFLKNL